MKLSASPRSKVTLSDIIGDFYYTEIEPIRDWKLWKISGHRLRTSIYIILGIVILYYIQDYLWPITQTPHTLLEKLWSLGAYLWLAAAIPAVMGFIGLLRFEHSHSLNTVLPIKTLVSFRIVSRGTNTEALTQTIRNCQKEMIRNQFFPFIIEVVIDIKNPELPKENSHLSYIVVPQTYKTSQGSLYKARALHYALENSKLPNDAWIVHLDEESHLTSSSIKGICEMISEEETAKTYRIGQGTILYHRKWKEHPILTLADSIRTGDDLGRFHFQHLLGITIFGLHGSFIVVRNDVEKSIGFDFGPKGSITEDAYWSLLAMQQGYRSRWVNGYIEEQSTHSVGDFIRQRRRWFEGLLKVTLYAPIDFKWRLLLGFNTIVWAIAPFAALYTIAYFFLGFSIPSWLHFFANFSFISFIVFYVIGLKVNLDEHGIHNVVKRIGWYIAQIILIPFFAIIESIGVLGVIFSPSNGFHIVKK